MHSPVAACFSGIALLFSIIYPDEAQPVPPAPTPLTLPAAWQLATAHNKQVLLQRKQVAIGQELVKDRRMARLPKVQAAGQYAYLNNLVLFEPRHGLANGEGIAVPPSPHAFDAHLGAEWELYAGGRIRSDIEAGQLSAAVETERLALTEAEVRLRVAAAYLELVRSQLNEDLAEATIRESEKQLRRIQALFRQGVVLRSDLLRAELQLSRRQLLHTEIRNTLTLANQRLNLLMGTPEDQPNEPVGGLPATPPLPTAYAAYLQQARIQAPELKIAGLQTRLSETRLDDVEAARRPHLSLYADYGYTYPNRLVFPNVAQIYGLGQVGAKVSYNLSALYTDRHAESAARLAVERQQLAADEALDDKRLEVKTACVRYQESLERIRVAEQNIGQATENYRIITRTYFNQLALLTDLLDADNQLLQSRFDLVTAQTQAASQYFQLQKALGTL